MVFGDNLSTMASTEKLPIYIESVEVTTTSTSSVEISWNINSDTIYNILGYLVHYQKVDSAYIQYGPHLPANVYSYTVNNLVADTYYRICLQMLRNDSMTSQKCVDASTRSWHIPVSIGSSIGAVLALSMIVLVILLLRWPSSIGWKRKQRSRKYDSISSHYNEDLYDFSESVTMTAGHDEMFSDQSDGYYLEIPIHSSQCQHENGQGDGLTNHYILHTVRPRKESLCSVHKHSPHAHMHCNHAHTCHHNGAIRHHSEQDTGILQDLNHNHHHHHHHGDAIVLHVSEEPEEEEQPILHHANTEPIFPSTLNNEFYEFEMKEMQDVCNMPEPEVGRSYLETAIDDDVI